MLKFLPGRELWSLSKLVERAEIDGYGKRITSVRW
jgi:hypothetical protein